MVREAVTIHCRTGPPARASTTVSDWAISTTQPFELRLPAGVVALDPRVRDDVDRAHLAPLLRLTRHSASQPRWDDDGEAVLHLESGSLVFRAHPTEVAWTITGPWGREWDCLPGGSVVERRLPAFPTDLSEPGDERVGAPSSEGG